MPFKMQVPSDSEVFGIYTSYLNMLKCFHY